MRDGHDFSTKCSVTFLCTPAILLIVLNALSAASSFNTSELSAHSPNREIYNGKVCINWNFNAEQCVIEHF